MDRRNVVAGPFAIADDWNHNLDAAADDLRSQARYGHEGCISGLAVDRSASVVTPGEAYVDGQRIRVRSAAPIDLAGVARPASGQFAWVAVAASYATETSGTLTDANGVQHDELVSDAATIRVVRGADAASANAAVRPAVRYGEIVLSDILFDHGTAIAALSTVSESRRPLCEIDRQRTEIDELWRLLRATLRTPAAPAAPTGSSTAAQSITWAWVAPSQGGSAIDRYQLQWRRTGEQWVAGNVIETTARTVTHLVADGTVDHMARVRAHNDGGWGEWGAEGTITGAAIQDAPPAVQRRFTASQNFAWPWPLHTRASIVVHGAAGGGGGGGRGGEHSQHVNPSPGNAGMNGVAGGTSSVAVKGSTYRANGGAAGPGGGGGAAASGAARGADGADGMNQSPPGGGAGGRGGLGQHLSGVPAAGRGGDGGDGGDGALGGTVTVTISGLMLNDVLVITVGRPGAGGAKGDGGIGLPTDGQAGTDAGYVEITPLT